MYQTNFNLLKNNLDLLSKSYILKYINILKFFNVESLTNLQQFCFAHGDAPRGSNLVNWLKIRQKGAHTGYFCFCQI